MATCRACIGFWACIACSQVWLAAGESLPALLWVGWALAIVATQAVRDLLKRRIP